MALKLGCDFTSSRRTVRWHSTSGTAQPGWSYGARNKNGIIRRQEDQLVRGRGQQAAKSTNLGIGGPQLQDGFTGNHCGHCGSFTGLGVHAVPSSRSTEKHKVFLSLDGKERKQRASEVISVAQITLKHQFSRARCWPCPNWPAQPGSPYSSFMSKTNPPAPKREWKRLALLVHCTLPSTSLSNSPKHWEP